MHLEILIYFSFKNCIWKCLLVGSWLFFYIFFSDHWVFNCLKIRFLNQCWQIFNQMYHLNSIAQLCQAKCCKYTNLSPLSPIVWPLGDATLLMNKQFSNWYQGYVSWAFSVKLPLDWSYYMTSLMINQYGLSNGLVPSDNKPLPEAMLMKSHEPYGLTRPQWVNQFNYPNTCY